MRLSSPLAGRWGVVVLALAFVALAFVALAAAPCRAQRIVIDADGLPLPRALDQVRTQTDLDLVYAQRLVAGATARCTYRGDEAEAALRCVLDGTGLVAVRVRRDQFVLVEAEAGASGAGGAPAPRVTLAGYVTDAATGERLPGAHVYLPALRLGAVANDAGYFAVAGLPRGRYRARISFLGYATRQVELAPADGLASVALRPVALTAEGVTVETTAGEDAEADTRPPGMLDAALADLERLPTFGEPDLFKALAWTPGIRKSGLLSGGLSVRGGQPDQNLYLLDGAPVYHPWHAFTFISTFQTGTLQTTRLYRDAFPVAYGGRLASVLDARMKDGDRSGPTATAAVGVLSARFRIESPLSDRVSFMVSGRRSYIDALVGRTHPVEDAAGRRDTLRTGYYFYDQSAKLTARLTDRQRATLSFYRGRDDLDLRLPFDLSLDFSSWLRPADLFFEVRQNWTNRVLSLRHEWLPSDRLFVTTTAYDSYYDAEEGSLVQPTATAALLSDYRVRLRDTGVRVETAWYRSAAHELRVGGQVSRLAFESDLASEIRRSADLVETEAQASRLGSWELAAFAQEVWRPSPRWTVQPGARLSAFSSGRRVHLRPRLSARFAAVPERLVLRAAVGGHVQYLHRLRDRYSLAYDLVSSRWVPASRRVAPATSWQASLGVQSRLLGAQGRLRPSVVAEASVYARAARNVLVPQDAYRTKDGLEGPGIEVGALLGQYEAARERAFGVEAQVVGERGPWQARLGGAAARTLLRVATPAEGPAEEPADPDEPPGYRPSNFDVPLALQAALSRHTGRWEATLAAEWRSGEPVSVPVARYRLGDVADGPDGEPTTYLYRPQINNGRLPPYARLDATLGYRFGLLTGDWRVRLTVYNLLNRANVVSRQYEPLPTGVRVGDRRGLPLLRSSNSN